MDVTLRIPDDVARRLSAAGGDVSRRALEALALEGYREQGGWQALPGLSFLAVRVSRTKHNERWRVAGPMVPELFFRLASKPQARNTAP